MILLSSRSQTGSIPNAGSPRMPQLFPNQAFGFGARQCPGRVLARASMWSNIAGILATFDITTTEDAPPEEAYTSGAISCVASALNKQQLMCSLL